MPSKHSKQQLAMAVSSVKDGGLSIREAERTYGVPFNTIRRRVNGSVNENFSKPGPKPALGVDIEEEIYATVVEMQKIGHGISRKEILEIAGKIDEKNDVKVFRNALPSQKWYKGFMRRHNLSLRQPENLSSARNSMATDTTKHEFFSKLEKLISELKVSGSDIYNVDESGLTMVNKSRKIIAPKGSKTVQMRKSGERSENITVVAACNATGTIIMPPMVIFKGVRMQEDLMKGAPENTIFGTSPKGYIDSELFYTLFVKFVNTIPAKRPVILLLDDHASHLSRETLLLAKENGVHFLMFPPHTTHLFQPLDVGVFGPLKKAFSLECTKLMRKNKRKYLNRRITTTRCVTSDEFLKEMDEKERKKPKTKKQNVISSESEVNDSGSDEQEEAVDDKCAQCSGSFRDDCNGESWIQCCNPGCKRWYHQVCQMLRNTARPKEFVCLSCRND